MLHARGEKEQPDCSQGATKARAYPRPLASPTMSASRTSPAFIRLTAAAIAIAPSASCSPELTHVSLAPGPRLFARARGRSPEPRAAHHESGPGAWPSAAYSGSGGATSNAVTGPPGPYLIGQPWKGVLERSRWKSGRRDCRWILAATREAPPPQIRRFTLNVSRADRRMDGAMRFVRVCLA